MKKLMFLFSVTLVVILVSCSKNATQPAYTPPVAKNFSVTSLKHTQDTVNVGDTIYLNVAGTMYDSSKNVYPYITATSSSSSFSWGTPPATLPSTKTPIKLSLVFGAVANGLYGWTSTIMLTGATQVPHKTTLTITGQFTYQLSLSSEGGGTASATDAGQSTKTVYIQ